MKQQRSFIFFILELCLLFNPTLCLFFPSSWYSSTSCLDTLFMHCFILNFLINMFSLTKDTIFGSVETGVKSKLFNKNKILTTVFFRRTLLFYAL